MKREQCIMVNDDDSTYGRILKLHMICERLNPRLYIFADLICVWPEITEHLKKTDLPIELVRIDKVLY